MTHGSCTVVDHLDVNKNTTSTTVKGSGRIGHA